MKKFRYSVLDIIDNRNFNSLQRVIISIKEIFLIDILNFNTKYRFFENVWNAKEIKYNIRYWNLLKGLLCYVDMKSLLSREVDKAGVYFTKFSTD